MAVENLHSFIGEIKRNKYSLLHSLSEDDFFHIWKVTSDFVKRQMQLHKAVTIPGLGAFTFSQTKIETGSKNFKVVNRPVFVLSEKLVQTHSLQYSKPHTSGQIPNVLLNFTVLSNETLFNRDSVETCVHEIIQAMSRRLAAKGSVQLEFFSVGRLFIRERKVKMRFFREFITMLDSSGEMETAFRPDTAHTELSIMTDPSPSRPPTQSLVLPKIVETSSGGASLSLEVSSVADCQEDAMSTKKEEYIDKQSTSVRKTSPLLRETKNGPGEILFELPSSSASASEKSPPESSRGNRVTPRNGTSDSRRLIPKPATLFVGEDKSTVPEQVQRHLANLGLSSPSAAPRPATEGKSDRAASTTEPQNEVQTSARPSTCSHSSPAGQELCYVCHQRELRNLPVYTAREKREHEKQQNKLLFEYQQRRDLLALAKEQAARMKTIGYNKEMASYNLDAAQRTKAAKMTKDTEFYPSYVFQERPLTPPRYIKQTHYCAELDDQVSHLNGQVRERREREEKEEREERIQLAKDLEVYQQAYLKERAAKRAHYQRALAEQIAITRQRGMLSTLNNHSNQSNSISKATPTSTNMAASACPIHAKGCRNGKAHPLSLPKLTTILPFTHSKTMTVTKDRHTKLVRMKPLFQRLEAAPPPPSPGQGDQNQPVFGVLPLEKRKEEREIARQIFLEQMAVAAEKDRRRKEKAKMARLEEADMLTRTRRDLIDDVRSERLTKVNMRKSLQQSWDQSIQERQCQLMEELDHSNQPSILLHQQCENYHRCKQCKRRTDNQGGSNILHDSRYYAGARLIV